MQHVTCFMTWLGYLACCSSSCQPLVGVSNIRRQPWRLLIIPYSIGQVARAVCEATFSSPHVLHVCLQGQRVINPYESRWFWIVLIANPVLWGLSCLSALFGLDWGERWAHMQQLVHWGRMEGRRLLIGFSGNVCSGNVLHSSGDQQKVC